MLGLLGFIPLPVDAARASRRMLQRREKVTSFCRANPSPRVPRRERTRQRVRASPSDGESACLHDLVFSLFFWLERRRT